MPEDNTLVDFRRCTIDHICLLRRSPPAAEPKSCMPHTSTPEPLHVRDRAVHGPLGVSERTVAADNVFASVLPLLRVLAVERGFVVALDVNADFMVSDGFLLTAGPILAGEEANLVEMDILELSVYTILWAVLLGAWLRCLPLSRRRLSQKA